jgi:pimeloyl-ACP methyl ester carboxylesterase
MKNHFRSLFVVAMLSSFFTWVSPAHAMHKCRAESVSHRDGDFEVRILRYRFGAAGAAGNHILILPPTGRTNFIDRSYGEMFCKAGFDVHILDGWTGDDEASLDLEIHSRLYSRALRAIGIVVDAAHGESNRRIGIFGTSVGGTFAAVAASAFPEIRAAFVVTGAASIASVIANSDQEILQQVRKKRFERHGFKSQGEYIAALERTIVLDPMKMERGFEGKSLGLVIAKKDTTVPVRYQMDLKNLWQTDQVIYLNAAHTWAIVSTWLFHSREITDFFRQSLMNEEGGRSRRSN